MLWLLFKQKLVGKGREKKKTQISVSFRSYPTRNRKFQTNRKKIQKIVKYYYGFFASKIRGETPRSGENKNYRHVPCQPDA